MSDYADFISRKSQLDAMSGFAPRVLPSFLFDFQKSLVDWAVRKGRAAIFADCGLGKALASASPVITPSGASPIGSLRAGDAVIGSDGRAAEVLGVFPQGTRRMFTVEFSDGSTLRADADHLWYVETQLQRYHNRKGRVLTTAALASQSLRDTVGRSRYFVPLVSAPVEYAPTRLPIDAYLLGVLLGDGSLGHRQGTIEITSADADLVHGLVLPDGLRAVRRKDDGAHAPTYRLSRERAGTKHRNALLVALEQLGLRGLYASEKFVPEAYLRSSAADRLAVLQGLMDTDGYGNSDGLAQFTSTSLRLARDVRDLAQGLGGTGTLRPKTPVCVMPDGRRIPGAPAWNVSVRLPHGMAPFRLDRKRSAWRPHESYTPCRSIRRIEPADLDDATCIAVRSPDQLFAAEHHILTHNTPMQLVWAQNVVEHTNRPVLILTPLAVSAPTVAEANKFGIDARRSDGSVFRGINVVNYERLHYFTPSDFAGVVCDESSILKSFDGRRRSEITEFMRKIEYRLLCTATAAPNDYIELGTSSEALGYLGHMDMLQRFFRHVDGTTVARHDNFRFKHREKELLLRETGSLWRLKGHAEIPFWRWVCSWARACRKPSDLGFKDDRFVLPPLVEREHLVAHESLAYGMLFSLPAVGLKEQRDERRRTIQERCEQAAALVNTTGKPALVWCHLNPEGDLLARLIPDAEQVSGADADDEKEAKFGRFTSGETRVLITKPKIGAWGLNFQHCAHVTFFPSHSFEQYYQGVRRCWRFGQSQSVRVDVVTTEGETGVLENLKRKARAADQMFDRLVEQMNNVLSIDRRTQFDTREEIPAWL